MALPQIKHAIAPPAKVVNFRSEVIVREKQELKPVESLTSKQRTAMIERLTFCKEVFQLAERGMSQLEAVEAAATRAELYPTLVTAGKNGKSTLTIHNYRSWKKLLGTKRGKPDFDNVKALADRYGLNIRGAKGAPEFWKTFNSIYLNQNKLSMEKSYKKAMRICKQNNIADIPSLRQVRYWMNTYADTAAVLSARHGEVWAENNLVGYIRRDWEEVIPNECWIGDHHVFDAPVKTWDKEKNCWVAVRPWLTGWLDAKSLFFTGLHIGVDSPSSKQILVALQNGIRLNSNTPPQILYNDNGKDYLKFGFTEIFEPKDTEHKHSIAQELGIRTINSLPYRARAKTIERMFGEVCEGFSKSWAAYLGNQPKARPEVAGYFWNNPELLPSLQEFCLEFARWLHEEYHQIPQEGIILNGKSPSEVWTRGTGGTSMCDHDLYFAMLLPYTKNCPKVGRGAAVTVDSKEYRSELLWPYFQQKIMVKLDVANDRDPHAFTLDGKYICQIEPIGKINALAKTDEDRQLISEELKRQRLEMKRAFAIADDMTAGMRNVSPQELMQLTPGNEPVIRKVTASGKSVKGGSHKFVLHTIGEERQLTKGEEKQKKLLEFGQAQKEKIEEEEINTEAIANFHNHLINKERNNEDEYENCW